MFYVLPDNGTGDIQVRIDLDRQVIRATRTIFAATAHDPLHLGLGQGAPVSLGLRVAPGNFAPWGTDGTQLRRNVSTNFGRHFGQVQADFDGVRHGDSPFAVSQPFTAGSFES